MEDNKELTMENKIDVTISRRTFVKKAMYVAPKLAILGTLSQPGQVFALGSLKDDTGTGFGGTGGGSAPGNGSAGGF